MDDPAMEKWQLNDPAMKKWHRKDDQIGWIRNDTKTYGFNLDDLDPRIPYYVDPVYKAAVRKHLKKKYPEDYESKNEWKDLNKHMWIDEFIEFCHTHKYKVLAKGPHVGLVPNEKSKYRVFISSYVVADAGVNSFGEEEFFILSALDLTLDRRSKQLYTVKADNTPIEDGKDGFSIAEKSIFYYPDRE